MGEVHHFGTHDRSAFEEFVAEWHGDGKVPSGYRNRLFLKTFTTCGDHLPREVAEWVAKITGKDWAHVATYPQAAQALMEELPGRSNVDGGAVA